MNTISDITLGRPYVLFKRVCWLVSLAVLLGFVIAGSIYIKCSHSTLETWFLSLGDCFYRREFWASEFFTPLVKHEGNRFALGGIITSLAGIAFMIFSRKQLWSAQSKLTFKLDNSWWKWYAGAVAMGLVFWKIGNRSVAGSTDEVFSAVYCASGHPFHILAYYMLPNNHIGFNFINGVFFGWIGDYVRSGRLISMMAYCGMLCVALRWLTGLIGSRLVALVGLLLIALQFTIWGFSFQGRGYELLLLCGWMSFYTITEYGQKGGLYTLRINALFSLLGFIVLPTYLYFYLAQVLYMVLVQVLAKRMDWKFWKYQVMLGGCIALFYMPALCFSGYRAFTENQFVKAAFPDVASFWQPFVEVIEYLINFCFSFIFGEGHPINYVLCALPLLLLVMPQRRQRLMGVFYVLICVMYCLVVLHMKRFPFNRNMILHYSLIMGHVVYTAYAVIALITDRLRSPALRTGLVTTLFVVPVLAYSVFLFTEDRKNVALNLFFYDVNELYNLSAPDMLGFPKGSSIAFSYEGFYWFYYCRKEGYQVTFCPGGNEQYFVKRGDEPMPAGYAEKYELEKKAFSNYEVYKLK